ncbi:transposase [[Clostridium] fimetarium]|uniref:Transposase n=1 Tax=[Clostridium] fimetarium TaxID=99656 RepID=A0A1I0NTC2_9FIRM|nr:transposase [[Clostridium] fimetarium]
MAKYSFEFKKQIAQEYLSGKGGYSFLAQKYAVGNKDKKMVCKWVKAYKEFGDEGLMRSRKKETYTFEFKLHVVELYISTEVSYQELALSVGINNPPLIAKWVNDFRIAGPDALRPKKKGRKKLLGLTDKEKNIPSALDSTAIDTNVEYVKQLEDELLKLRIENAYLKELRRLRLEDEARLREQQESSTASEETSN